MYDASRLRGARPLTNADMLLVARTVVQNNMTLVAEMAALIAKEADVQENGILSGPEATPAATHARPAH